MSNHKLLERQLQKCKLSKDILPQSVEQWNELLSKISVTYEQDDESRKRLERALELSSKEMIKRWESLQESEQLKRVIIESSVDGFITTDSEGVILSVNPVIEEIFKYNSNKMFGQNILNFINNYDSHFLTNKNTIQFKKIVKIEMSGIIYEQDKLSGLTDKKEFPIEVTCIPLQLENHNIYSWYIRNLSSQREMEQKLNKQSVELALNSKLVALGEMAGSIAHEINTPLTTIKLSVELMRRNLESGSPNLTVLSEKIEIVNNTIKRVSEIIKNLKNIARDGSIDPLVVESIGSIIKSTTLLCAERFRLSGVKFEVEGEENSEVKIFCQSVQLTQVLTNLLNNAFDAIETLSEKWIKLILKSNSEEVSIYVIDSGKGIPKNVREKMFNPYFTTKEVGKGTGLGLSISVGIITNHHGTLTLDDSASNTTFVIKIPIAKAIAA